MAVLMLSNIQVKDNILNDEKYKYIFSVEAVNALVNQGISFREAYKQIGDQINDGSFNYRSSHISHTHEGSIGNLCTEQCEALMSNVLSKFK